MLKIEVFTILVLATVVYGQSINDLDLVIGRQRGLDQHNMYRQKHGVGKLILNDTLNKMALDLATHLSLWYSGYNPNFRVSSAVNLFISSPYLVSYFPQQIQNCFALATDMWYSEISDYDFATGYPKNDLEETIGHFTRLIWKSTTQVGFAAFRFPQDEWLFIVAYYSKPGNIQGEYITNVLPAQY